MSAIVTQKWCELCSKVRIKVLEQGRSALSVSLVDFEQINICWDVIKSLLNDFWSILKMLCSKCC